MENSDKKDIWNRVISSTKIIRQSLLPLQSKKVTKLPYIFLAQSEEKKDITVVKKGYVHIHHPILILPKNSPQFEGDGFDSENLEPLNLLMIRGVQFPSLQYNHASHSTDFFSGTYQMPSTFTAMLYKKKKK